MVSVSYGYCENEPQEIFKDYLECSKYTEMLAIITIFYMR